MLLEEGGSDESQRGLFEHTRILPTSSVHQLVLILIATKLCRKSRVLKGLQVASFQAAASKAILTSCALRPLRMNPNLLGP